MLVELAVKKRLGLATGYPNKSLLPSWDPLLAAKWRTATASPLAGGGGGLSPSPHPSVQQNSGARSTTLTLLPRGQTEEVCVPVTSVL